METKKQFQGGGLTFLKPVKVRKTKNSKQILVFLNETTVFAINTAYLAKILESKPEAAE